MDSDGEHNDNAAAPSTGGGSTISSLALLANLLGNPSIGLSRAQINMLLSHGDDDDIEFVEDEEDDEQYLPWSRRGHSLVPGDTFSPVKEPQEAGVNLLNSGEFGRVGYKEAARNSETPEQSITKLIRQRYEGVGRRRSALSREELMGNLVPNSNGTAVASYDANIYTARFSRDSSLYYTCSQDFRLYIFDASMPRATSSASRLEDPYISTNMAVKRRIMGHPGQWTITDANLSPDNQRMVYSSLRAHQLQTGTAHITSTTQDNPQQIPIRLSDRYRGHEDYYGASIYSCTFSADGNEIVAGVYDLLADRRSVKINAHDDDVNSCCWADTSSGNVLVSASDDSYLKVWDRRSLGQSPRPSGVLMGHTEGITYVSAKGDGRYVISNGKDQSVRLWDLRNMRSAKDHDNVRNEHYGSRNFDYRRPPYRRGKYTDHPQDCSVMTYRGHAVLRTLIRCHFSPDETTGSQYIYSGSADGKIHIWSLDGTLVQVLDRSKSLPLGQDASAAEYPPNQSKGRASVCVRDVSWSGQEPVLMSAGWNTGRGSILARHEWKNLSKLGHSLEDWVAKDAAEKSERGSTPGRLSMPGTWQGNLDDEEEWIEEDEEEIEVW
ncbi:WD40 repeat-like protein [Cylindrobasidium torrendii FP15055 ss-10]|uniref:WD40 repeat-like protein n=1 Tax=Cylindrobasidium torrendii FP15055 ss-10 TaxID=1314674 RepID=A0A0D7BSL5_9AGAR|nr:WD40 repeat-like protein [Cylindrobasidium torrendii FP15055 ss-10]